MKVGALGAASFDARVRELVDDHSAIAAVVIPLPLALEALRTQLARLHKLLLDTVRVDPICRRLMAAPGVGPVVALSYRACVDNPTRFSRLKNVGAHYGLTPRLYQSGEVSRTGRVWRCGDAMMRAAFYEAALVLLTSPRGRWKSLKAWGMGVTRRRGIQKAIVGVARTLAIVLHRMWRDGTQFRWSVAETIQSIRPLIEISSSSVGGDLYGDDGSGRDRGNSSSSPTDIARLRWLRPLPLIPS